MPGRLVIDADAVRAVVSGLKPLQAALLSDQEHLTYLSAQVQAAVRYQDLGASTHLQQAMIQLHATIALLQQAEQGLLAVVKDTLHLEEEISAGAASGGAAAHADGWGLPEQVKQWLDRLGLGLFGAGKWGEHKAEGLTDQIKEGVEERLAADEKALAKLERSLSQPAINSDAFKGWKARLEKQVTSIEAEIARLKADVEKGHWEEAGRELKPLEGVAEKLGGLEKLGRYIEIGGRFVPIAGIPLDYLSRYGLTWNEKGAAGVSIGGGLVLASDLLTGGILPAVSGGMMLVGGLGGAGQEKLAQLYGGPIGPQLQAPGELLKQAGDGADITKVADDIGFVGADLFVGLPAELSGEPMPAGFHADVVGGDLLPDLTHLASDSNALLNAPNQFILGVQTAVVDDTAAGAEKLIQITPFIPQSFKQDSANWVADGMNDINGVAKWIADSPIPLLPW